MRKGICLLLTLLLLVPCFAALAEEPADEGEPAEQVTAEVTAVEEEEEEISNDEAEAVDPDVIDEDWANKKVNYERRPEAITVIPWEELPETPETVHHYLLLCVDRKEGKVQARPADAKTPEKGANRSHGRDLYGNTDGIVIVTLDTRAKRVMLTSIIREALVLKPNGGIGRINYVYNDYGPEALCKLISEHLGIKIEKYIIFNFTEIENIVDFLGGTDVELTAGEINYLRNWAVPPGSVFDTSGVDIRDKRAKHEEGMYHFNGHSAVIYMRIRKSTGHGDFMRTQRVRNVLSNLADKCREVTLDEAYALANCVLDNSTMTNMNLDEMRQAAEYAFALRGCTIEELRIPQDHAVRPIKYLRMETQEVNWTISRRDMADYLQNSFLVIDDSEEDDDDDL